MFRQAFGRGYFRSHPARRAKAARPCPQRRQTLSHIRGPARGSHDFAQGHPAGLGRGMKLLLLDANVLLSLAWPTHPFHHRAVTRLARRERRRWATCMLTQAAFVRLSSNPAIIPGAKSPAEAGYL